MLRRQRNPCKRSVPTAVTFLHAALILLGLVGCDHAPRPSPQVDHVPQRAVSVEGVTLSQYASDRWCVGIADGWTVSEGGGWTTLKSPNDTTLGIMRVERDGGAISTDDDLQAFLLKDSPNRELTPVALGDFSGYSFVYEEKAGVVTRFWMVRNGGIVLSIVHEGEKHAAAADEQVLRVILHSLKEHPNNGTPQ